jgi:zinc D-Ala-D-Ala carboxypeptidase
MSQHRSAPQAARGPRTVVLALLAAGAAVLALASCLTTPATSSPAAPASTASHEPAAASGARPDHGGGRTDEADGRVPNGTTVFDDALPAVAGLDPALLAALRAAATDAERDGVTFSVTSGWRSPQYQDQLLREAVAQYGSAAEAARWVATADTSSHVSGDAVDLGQTGATEWLSAHGAAYGLCPVYRNEPWHYELRPDAPDDGCPPLYDDPSQDPRLRR